MISDGKGLAGGMAWRASRIPTTSVIMVCASKGSCVVGQLGIMKFL